MKPSVLLSITATLLVAAISCGDPADTAAPEVQAAGAPIQWTVPEWDVRSVDSVPYNLYTHCGIVWARVRGTFWHAVQVSDGNGDPLQGWGNPYQSGRLTFTSSSVAIFTSTAGRVTLHRTSRSEPPYICS
jgi:hypothetical protein